MRIRLKDAMITIANMQTRSEILQAAENALKQSGISGIYTEFEDLQDAVEQMASHIKELTADKREIAK